MVIQLELNERKQKILAAIVEQYIKTGEPVGSKLVMNELNLALSSATIRNEMSELVSWGYLEQPHTSSGRVPSQKGYRYYIDNLMLKSEIDETSRKLIEAGISSVSGDPGRLLEQAGELLAELTNCAAVSTTPQGEGAQIRRIELITVGSKTAMLVLLTSTGVLKSRMCRVESELNASVCEVFHNIMEQALIGERISEITHATMQGIAASLGANALLLMPLLAGVSDLVQSTAQAQILLEGQSNLLGHRELGSNVYELIDFLNKGEPFGSLLTSYKDPSQVFIGKESQYRQLENSSIILSKYKISGGESGSIGIVGPTRIDYARLIPSVKYLTDLVSRLMTQALEE